MDMAKWIRGKTFQEYKTFVIQLADAVQLCNKMNRILQTLAPLKPLLP